jgi:hypothetical protein
MDQAIHSYALLHALWATTSMVISSDWVIRAARLGASTGLGSVLSLDWERSLDRLQDERL